MLIGLSAHGSVARCDGMNESVLQEKVTKLVECLALDPAELSKVRVCLPAAAWSLGPCSMTGHGIGPHTTRPFEWLWVLLGS